MRSIYCANQAGRAMKMLWRIALTSAAVWISIPVAAQNAQWFPVDFSSQANFTWTGPETDPGGPSGVYMPGGPNGSVTLGGVPFNIKSNANGYQAWNAWTAAGGGSAQQAITIPVGVYGVTDAYTLLNTYWGSGTCTALVFTGSAGATYTKNLTNGTDIRDWLGANGPLGSPNTINVYATNSSQIYNPGRLDMQHITLPAAFATQTLTSVNLVDTGATRVSRAILDGLTVSYQTNKPFVSGTITLGDCNDPEQNITFELRPKNGGALIKIKQVLTQSGPNSGTFSLPNIPAGTYDIAIKGYCWLKKVLPSVVVNGNVSGLTATLVSADINNDNSVDSTDFGLLIGEFNNTGDP